MESPRCVYQPMMIVQRVPDQLAPIMLQVVDISEQETFELVRAIREQATQEAEAESLEPFAVLSIEKVAEGYKARVRRGTEQYTITVRR